MDLSRVSRSEIVAVVGGVLLGVSVWLSWYHATAEGHIDKVTGPHTFSGWEVHKIIRFLLLAAAVAPLILTYIIARGHALSWPRGELTAVVAIAAFGLVFYNGVITRPGDPRGQISLEFGFFVAIAGSLLMLGGAAKRSAGTERPRKPPGTL